MKFVWHSKKATANLAKHHLDFRDAIKIFDHDVVEWIDERFDYGEERWIAIGLLEGKEIFVAYSEVGAETRRIITARLATRLERERYWDEIGGKNGLGPSQEHDR